MAETMKVYVNQDSPRAASEATEIMVKGSKRGELCILDFYTAMALERRAFQVQAGTITAPLTGDILITDTAAEMCVDAPSGLVVLPTYLNVTIESIAGATLPECAAKSVAGISSSGTVYTPLPLFNVGGVAATATARVQAAGSVTVTAELVTTTRQHFHALAAAVGNFMLANHTFRMPPVVADAACFYVQVAATTAGPTYFAFFNFIELPLVNVS